MEGRSDLRTLVGETIRKLRAARDLTQSDVAGYVNIRPATLSDIERGVNLPDLMTAVNLAGLFGVTVDALLEGTATPRAVSDESESLGRTVGLLQVALEKAIETIDLHEARLAALESGREGSHAPRRKPA